MQGVESQDSNRNLDSVFEQKPVQGLGNQDDGFPGTCLSEKVSCCVLNHIAEMPILNFP